MVDPKDFVEGLRARGTDFWAGVPDSLLKSFCAYITDNIDSDHHIIACNEGSAIGLAVGHYLSVGTTPVVYMQNSGLGNTVNPLLSLADEDVYSIPIILIIGWRGLPGEKDEPQHVKQGKVTLALLDAMRIPYVIMSENSKDMEKQLDYSYKMARESSAPVAIVVKKGTFSPYQLKIDDKTDDASMTRESAIDLVARAAGDSVIVSTTGMASRELFELREKYKMGHEKDFLTVGGMGHASSIALSIALARPDKKVIILDGDGASLMHLGSYTTIGVKKPSNLTHIVLNNGAHDSVGGQATVGRLVDLLGVARAAGYPAVIRVDNQASLGAALENMGAGLTFIEVRVKKGARADLGRPTTTPKENKVALMKYLRGE